jgi:hypothetical protein
MQLILDYLVVFCSLLQSELLVFAIWLVIMTEVSHHRSSPVFPFNNVDDPGLRWDCFDRCDFKHLKKISAGIEVLWVAALDTSSAS